MKTIEELEAQLTNMEATLSAIAARDVEIHGKLGAVIVLANDLHYEVGRLKIRNHGVDARFADCAKRLATLDAATELTQEQCKAMSGILMRLRDGLR